MAPRLQLQTLLESLVPEGWRVYFQPPTDIQMQHPCIVYERDAAQSEHADNGPYRFTQRYQVKVITRDPDDGVREKIAALPLCSFDRFYTATNLNHDVFNLFF